MSGSVPAKPSLGTLPGFTPKTRKEILSDAVQLPIDLSFIELIFTNTVSNIVQTLPNGFNIVDGMELLVRNEGAYNVDLAPGSSVDSIDGTHNDFTVQPNTSVLLKFVSEDSDWVYIKVTDTATHSVASGV